MIIPFMHLSVNAKKLLYCGKAVGCDYEQQNWGGVKNTSWTAKLVEIHWITIVLITAVVSARVDADSIN